MDGVATQVKIVCPSCKGDKVEPDILDGKHTGKYICQNPDCGLLFPPDGDEIDFDYEVAEDGAAGKPGECVQASGKTADGDELPPAACAGVTDELIRAALDDLHTAQAAHNAAKDEAKARKEELDAAQDWLNKLIERRFGEDGAMPLFDSAVAPGENADDFNARWRAVRLDALDIPVAVTATLAEDGIETVGDIQDRRDRDPDWSLCDVPGIGEAKAEKVQKALDDLAVSMQAPQKSEEPEAADDGQ